MRPVDWADGLERFRELVLNRMGHDFAEGRTEELARVLEARLGRAASSLPEYLNRLEKPGCPEWQTLIPKLTIQESYFFRNAQHFKVVRERVLLDEAFAGRGLQFLSAGCSRGQEPYSLAILLDQTGREGRVRALDINEESLVDARLGRYSSWSLRQTPAAVVERYFREVQGKHELCPRIRERVVFEQQNLVEPRAVGEPDSIDVIFCRNVLMYLSHGHARDLIDRFERALKPGGYIFFGHAESMRMFTTELRLCMTHATFYYRKGAPPSRVAGPRAPATPPSSVWFEEIEKAGARISALCHSSEEKRREAAPPRAVAVRRGRGLAEAREAFQRESFGEAAALLGRLPESDQALPEAALLRAAILVQRGELEDALGVLEELVELDGLDPGHRYLLAYCREQLGDLSGSRDGYRSVVYLDRRFALAHWGLGRLAGRAGRLREARRELALACELLPGEHASRLLLFGGGLGRAGLLGLCQTELAKLEDEAR